MRLNAHFIQSLSVPFCLLALCPHLYLYMFNSSLETEVRSALKGRDGAKERGGRERVRSRIDSDCEAPVSALIRECAVLTKWQMRWTSLSSEDSTPLKSSPNTLCVCLFWMDSSCTHEYRQDSLAFIPTHWSVRWRQQLAVHLETVRFTWQYLMLCCHGDGACCHSAQPIRNLM